jgi:hypothetical protein
MAQSEPTDKIATVDEFILWVSLLVKMMRKHGLFPADEVYLMDDGDESYNIMG